MKSRIFLLNVFLLVYGSLYSQFINYGYDNAGNCNSRNVITLRSAVEADDKQEVYDDELFSDIKIYPNPTKGLLRINIGNYSIQDDVSFEVYDLTGKQLIKNKASLSNIELDLSSYNNGIYVLIIKRNGNKSDWKIIKTN